MTRWWRTLADRDCDEAMILHLFGGPYLTLDSRRIAVPESSKRLLAFVALHGCRVDRRLAAGTLWPIGDDMRAAGNLRSALWRLNRSCWPIIEADKTSLELHEEVIVDVRVVSQWACRLIAGEASNEDLSVGPDGTEALDLLPGWYDDWALMERERMRQRLLHALEALSETLLLRGRCGEAVEAAMLAVTSEPLRESAQRTLIEAHLAEGNWIEARRQYETYRRLLKRELGAEPQLSLAHLVRHIAPSPQPHLGGRRAPVGHYGRSGTGGADGGAMNDSRNCRTASSAGSTSM